MSVLNEYPRFMDFDNKRSFFRNKLDELSMLNYAIYSKCYLLLTFLSLGRGYRRSVSLEVNRESVFEVLFYLLFMNLEPFDRIALQSNQFSFFS